MVRSARVRASAPEERSVTGRMGGVSFPLVPVMGLMGPSMWAFAAMVTAA